MGFSFDFYRIIRWRIGFNRVLTFIGDLLFSLLALLVIYYFAQKANYLELRFYLFGGTLLGLLLYLRFFSPACKRIFTGLLSLIVRLGHLVVSTITLFFKVLGRILRLIMSIPYNILRWISLLFFRMGEAIGKESVAKIKSRITNSPRQ